MIRYSMIRSAFPALVLLFFSVPSASAFPGDTVVLQGLDKVTARISTFEVSLEEEVTFGTLRITLRACDRTPPEEPPESTAFLDIYEAKPGDRVVSLFHGWMFASSPALSALEHPVYDIWVKECVASEPLELEPAGEQ